MSAFRSLVERGIVSDTLISTVEASFGFSELTPVQAATIPRFLAYQDVAVEACTGSGKTLAYILPLYQLLLRSEHYRNDQTKKGCFTGIGALIISPTRELASQIAEVASKFSSSVGLGLVLCTGGYSFQLNLEDIRRPTSNILIGTPGRICDLFQRGNINMKSLEVLILDEADVLLDMGFEKSLNDILHRLPKQRRTGLFSATQTRKVKELIRAGLRNPAIISVQVEHNGAEDTSSKGLGLQCVPSALKNYFAISSEDAKLGNLIRFVENHPEAKFIIFFSTCATVDFYARVFKLLPQLNSFPIYALHGRMKQSKRDTSYASFVQASRALLLCTDVAARGIDIPDVDWIIQFHAPQDPSFYIHRIGRTARAGRAGNALIFLLPKEDAYVSFLQAKKVPMEPFTIENRKAENERLLEIVKREQFKDRDILEKGTKAFIAHIRSYKEHKCSFIFRITDLDMSSVAKAFVLLRVPKLSELRETSGISGFKTHPLEEVSAIKFKDKNREKQRQKKLRSQAIAKNSKTIAPKTQKKTLVYAKAGVKPKRKKKKGVQQKLFEEWDELAREERLRKKHKKGKISDAEYNKLLFSS